MLTWRICWLAILVILVVLVACGSGKSAKDCLKDLDCVADKTDWWSGADARCASHIEARASYSARWTDGFLELKFDRVSLQPPEYQTLRFKGNKVEFQNGFGAWRRMEYVCFYDPIDQTVMSVEVW